MTYSLYEKNIEWQIAHALRYYQDLRHDCLLTQNVLALTFSNIST